MKLVVDTHFLGRRIDDAVPEQALESVGKAFAYILGRVGQRSDIVGLIESVEIRWGGTHFSPDAHVSVTVRDRIHPDEVTKKYVFKHIHEFRLGAETHSTNLAERILSRAKEIVEGY